MVRVRRRAELLSLMRLGLSRGLHGGMHEAKRCGGGNKDDCNESVDDDAMRVVTVMM
jgi:hypothetical protein